MLLDSQEFARFDFRIYAGSARERSASAALSRAYQERGVTFRQGYGLTELGDWLAMSDEALSVRLFDWPQ